MGPEGRMVKHPASVNQRAWILTPEEEEPTDGRCVSIAERGAVHAPSVIPSVVGAVTLVTLT